MFGNIFDAMHGCEYVPPCQRDPYYDDPRDKKPSWEDIAKNAAGCVHEPDYTAEASEPYFDQTVYAAHDMTPNLETVQEMAQCPKCGTFFIMERPTTMIFGVPQVETLCHECRRKIQKQQKDES